MKFAGFRYHGRKAAMKKVSQRYTEFLQVYFIAGDLDAVGPEAVGLFVGTAEGKGTGEFPFGIDHAVAGDMVGIRVLVQGIAHGPGPSSVLRPWRQPDRRWRRSLSESF